MDGKFNIPNYPNICLVCFEDTNEKDSVSIKAKLLDEGENFWSTLVELCALEENTDAHNFPQIICRKCAKQIESFQAFRRETIANQLFLKAWTAYKFGAKPDALAQLLREETKYLPLIRKTLYRLKIIDCEDASLNNLIKDSNQHPELVVKVEVKVESEDTEDPLICFLSVTGIDDDSNQNDIDWEEESLKPIDQIPALFLDGVNNPDFMLSNRRMRSVDEITIVDGVRTRPCYLENCDPVLVGQGDRHTREKHRSYCRICGLVFLTHSQAMYHLAIHQNNEDRYQCEVCEKPFWREFGLKLHRREFHGIDNPSHHCPACNERFKKKVDLLKHRETHTMCRFCRKQFKSYRTMLQHMRKEHRDKLLPCNVCKALFLGTQEFEMHAKKHLDGRMENSVQFAMKNWTAAQCTMCERDFYSHDYLNYHKEKDHKNGLLEKPIRNKNFKRRTQEELDRLEYKFKCRDCPTRFRLKTSLKAHWMKNHSGQKFICEHCGSCFKSKPELKVHANYMHTKDSRFECEYCDKRCITKNDLKIHTRTHTNEKPYKCSFEGCDKAYKTQSAVTKHFRVHTGEKPYKCAYEGCDKAYACSQLLKIHTRNHTLEKPFKCWYCELYFNSTNNRRKHCHRFHAGLPIGRELERLNAMKNATSSDASHNVNN